jgi:hypothetical protein
MARGMATQRRHNDQRTTWVTGRTKKEGSLVPPKKTHSPLQRGLMELSRPWSAAAMRRSAHLKGGWGTRLKAVETWFVVLIGL